MLKVRFTRHALKRIRERFGTLPPEVRELIERAVTKELGQRQVNGRWALTTSMNGRLVRIVFVPDSWDVLWIVTVI